MKLIKVVRFSDVERLTLDGWHLVHTIENVQHIEVTRELVKGAHNNDRGYWVPDEHKIETHVITSPLFMLEIEAEGHRRMQQLEGDLGRANMDIESLKLGHAKAVDERSKAESRIAQLEGEHALSAKLRRDAEDRNRKLEADLAKIRKEIGEAEWRRVVG